MTRLVTDPQEILELQKGGGPNPWHSASRRCMNDIPQWDDTVLERVLKEPAARYSTHELNTFVGEILLVAVAVMIPIMVWMTTL